jgi:hypothetical protein
MQHEALTSLVRYHAARGPGRKRVAPPELGGWKMEMNPDMQQTAEIEDALGACDELHAVLARLKRLGLLTDDEDQETRDSIQSITETLTHKLPDNEE